MVVGVGIPVSVGASPVASVRAAVTPPTYTWPEYHQNSSLTGVSADPSLNTSDAADLGVHWMTNVGSEVLSSPIVSYNTTLGLTLVYVATTAGLVTAYNQATGLPVWSVAMGGYITSTPLAEGTSLWVAVQNSGRLYKLDAATGGVVCSASSPLPAPLYSSPVLATPPGGNPTIYIGGMDSQKVNGSVMAVDEATCHVDFLSSPMPGPGFNGVWDPISYGVDANGEGLVLFGTADPDESLYAVDAVTGNLVWRFSTYVRAGDYDIGGGITVSPPGVNGFADGVAYGMSKAGNVYALDLTTGALLWSYNFGAGGLSSAALSGTDLVFGDEGGVICLNAVTGALRWQSSAGSAVFTTGPVAIVGPVGSQIVAYGDLNGTFRVLSLATGAQLYSYQTGSYISGGVAETDGNVIEAGADGFLYDFAPGGGDPPAPTTAVTAPAAGSTIANPGGPLTITGTASSTSAIGAVDVAVQQDGTDGLWWDSASGTWTPEPYPNSATLSAPGATTTGWSMTVPTTAAGGGMVAYASAVDSDGIADISAEQSPLTPSRDAFTVLARSSSPDIAVANPYISMFGSFSVTGHGFGHDETLSFTLNGLAVGTATATADGVVTAKTFSVPKVDTFGPQTLVARKSGSGTVATTTTVYVTNAWSQSGNSSTHSNFESNDSVLREHIGISAGNYMADAWSFTTGAAIAGSVDVVDGVAYVADATGRIDAIDVQTGLQKWSTDAAGSSRIDTTPAVVGGLVIVGSVNHSLYALEAATGRMAWTTVLHGAIESSPSAAGPDIFVGDDAGDVYALTASTGKVLWRSTAAGTIKDSPDVDTSTGTVVVGGGTGVIRAFSLTNGALRWSYTAGGSIGTSPISNSGTVYVGSSNGDEYAVSESTGDLVWRHATGGPINASATLVAIIGPPTELLVPSGHTLEFLSLRTGAVLSSTVEPATVVGTAAADDLAVAELSTGGIAGTRYATDDPRAWVTSLPTTLSSSPTVINGEVFVTGNDGTVQCWTVPGSPAV